MWETTFKQVGPFHGGVEKETNVSFFLNKDTQFTKVVGKPCRSRIARGTFGQVLLKAPSMSLVMREGRYMPCSFVCMGGEKEERIWSIASIAELLECPPDSCGDSAPMEVPRSATRLEISFSIIFETLDRRLIGRYPFAVVLSFPFFGIRTQTADFHRSGQCPCLRQAL